MDLTFRVTLRDGSSWGQTVSFDGRELHVRDTRSRGHFQAIEGKLTMPMAADERLMMNGYQTWTHCPEYKKTGRIRGLRGLPRFLIDRYGLDRYGDYHFVPYPNKRRQTHGFSWCCFRRGETVRLLASLDEAPGYTVFRYDAGQGVMTVLRDAQGVAVDGDYALFDLFYMEGDEKEVFDAWFKALGVTPRTQNKLAGYSSWYNRYENISETTVTEDLLGCRGVLRPGDVFQIDDGWEPCVGDWLSADEKKFPHGLKAMADRIHQAGFLAGLWLAPFVCAERSAVYREHPDWLLRVDGKPWRCGCNWGGFYALDIDVKQVEDYIRKSFDRVFSEWGFDLVKLDFLYGAAPFGGERESRAGRMIRAMDLLRDICGDKLILGCGVPVMPAFGRVDYCRIGCDVSLSWDDKPHMRLLHRERVSTRHAIDNTLFRRQLNGRAYLSDPDVFFLRRDNLRLNDRQKERLALVNALLGGVLLMSDDPGRYDPAQKEQYRRLRHVFDHAADVRVTTQGRRCLLHYVLDGQRHTLVVR